MSVPSGFLCPLSGAIMTDPVTIDSGYTFERSSIEQWLRSGKKHCPMSKQPLADDMTVPNLAVRRLIAEWQKGNDSPLSPGKGGRMASSQTSPGAELHAHTVGRSFSEDKETRKNDSSTAAVKVDHAGLRMFGRRLSSDQDSPPPFPLPRSLSATQRHGSSQLREHPLKRSAFPSGVGSPRRAMSSNGRTPAAFRSGSTPPSPSSLASSPPLSSPQSSPHPSGLPRYANPSATFQVAEGLAPRHVAAGSEFVSASSPSSPTFVDPASSHTCHPNGRDQAGIARAASEDKGGHLTGDGAGADSEMGMRRAGWMKSLSLQEGHKQQQQQLTERPIHQQPHQQAQAPRQQLQERVLRSQVSLEGDKTPLNRWQRLKLRLELEEQQKGQSQQQSKQQEAAQQLQHQQQQQVQLLQRRRVQQQQQQGFAQLKLQLDRQASDTDRKVYRRDITTLRVPADPLSSPSSYASSCDWGVSPSGPLSSRLLQSQSVGSDKSSPGTGMGGQGTIDKAPRLVQQLQQHRVGSPATNAAGQQQGGSLAGGGNAVVSTTCPMGGSSSSSSNASSMQASSSSNSSSSSIGLSGSRGSPRGGQSPSQDSPAVWDVNNSMSVQSVSMPVSVRFADKAMRGVTCSATVPALPVSRAEDIPGHTAAAAVGGVHGVGNHAGVAPVPLPGPPALLAHVAPPLPPAMSIASSAMLSAPPATSPLTPARASSALTPPLSLTPPPPPPLSSSITSPRASTPMPMPLPSHVSLSSSASSASSSSSSPPGSQPKSREIKKGPGPSMSPAVDSPPIKSPDEMAVRRVYAPSSPGRESTKSWLSSSAAGSSKAIQSCKASSLSDQLSCSGGDDSSVCDTPSPLLRTSFSSLFSSASPRASEGSENEQRKTKSVYAKQVRQPPQQQQQEIGGDGMGSEAERPKLQSTPSQQQGRMDKASIGGGKYTVRQAVVQEAMAAGRRVKSHSMVERGGRGRGRGKSVNVGVRERGVNGLVEDEGAPEVKRTMTAEGVGKEGAQQQVQQQQVQQCKFLGPQAEEQAQQPIALKHGKPGQKQRAHSQARHQSQEQQHQRQQQQQHQQQHQQQQQQRQPTVMQKVSARSQQQQQLQQSSSLHGQTLASPRASVRSMSMNERTEKRRAQAGDRMTAAGVITETAYPASPRQQHLQQQQWQQHMQEQSHHKQQSISPPQSLLLPAQQQVREGQVRQQHTDQQQHHLQQQAPGQKQDQQVGGAGAVRQAASALTPVAASVIGTSAAQFLPNWDPAEGSSGNARNGNGMMMQMEGSRAVEFAGPGPQAGRQRRAIPWASGGVRVGGGEGNNLPSSKQGKSGSPTTVSGTHEQVRSDKRAHQPTRPVLQQQQQQQQQGDPQQQKPHQQQQHGHQQHQQPQRQQQRQQLRSLVRRDSADQSQLNRSPRLGLYPSSASPALGSPRAATVVRDMHRSNALHGRGSQGAAGTSGSSSSSDNSRQGGSEPSMEWMVALGEATADRAAAAAEGAAATGGGLGMRRSSTVGQMSPSGSGVHMGSRTTMPRGGVKAAGAAGARFQFASASVSAAPNACNAGTATGVVTSGVGGVPPQAGSDGRQKQTKGGLVSPAGCPQVSDGRARHGDLRMAHAHS